METNRDLTLDYAKGFAIVFIVLGHLYFFADRQVGSWVYTVCNTIQIPVFMYISGLLAHRSIDRYGFRKLVANRAVRLLLPLLSFYIIKGIGLHSKFVNIPLAEYKHGLWFLIVLFEFMVSLSFVKRLSQKIRVPAPVINAILFGVVTVYLYVLPRGNIFNILFCINLYWHYYPFFMMGYYSYKLYKVMTWYYVPIYLIVFLVSLYCIQVRDMKLFVPIGNLSSLLLLITLFKNGCRPFETFLAKLGVLSLQIYLLHFSILFIVLPYLPVIENRWLEFLVYFVVAFSFIMLSVGISKVLMRSRLLSLLLFGMKKK
ncbi:MAG: acyltransferase [Alphaproteobacteria bacterium]|nr:acyltransferase [Alphaproteobacteria bacterium]